MSTNGSKSSSSFTFVIILLLSSIIVTMMIHHCNGFLVSSNSFSDDQCNGTMGAGCPTLLLEEDEEFLMDTEEHRRILQGQNTLSYNGLQPQQPFCKTNGCSGRKLYNAGRTCTLANGCAKS